jgi:hypothetical protein
MRASGLATLSVGRAGSYTSYKSYTSYTSYTSYIRPIPYEASSSTIVSCGRAR